MNKQVYGYVRVSTATQKEKGYGLDTQRAAIIKYCKENNLELLHIFEDKGISGTADEEHDEPISKRPALIEMLADLNGTNTVIVLNTSRLWRNDTAKVFIRRELLRAKGDIISIEQPRYSIYNNDPQEKFINGIMELLDELERGSIALKLAKGRTTKARRGDKPAGLAPYGYKYSADKKKIVLVDHEAAAVKRMFALVLNGSSLQQIADTLNVEGIKTRRGNDWLKAGVRSIVTNTFYTGVLTHQQESIQGNHEAIISKVQFGKVKAVLQRNRRNKA